jgi:uncharacterized membrane protein
LAFFLPRASQAQQISVIPSDADWKEKIQTGDMDWVDIIYFLMHLIQLLLSLAAMIAVILVMYGGFQVIFGTIADNKESGKTTVRNALIGLALVLLSWIIVDIIIAFITSS